MQKVFNFMAVAALVLAVIVGFSVLPSSPSTNVRGVTNYDTVDVSDGYLVDGTSVITGGGAVNTAVDSVFGGGLNALTLTTSNTATSSMTVGCINQYASSTATSWKFVIVASSTQMAPGYDGLVYAKYGICP